MHIVHVVQLYHRASGAARYFIEIGERLVREGHRVTVLTSDAFDLEHFWAPGRRTLPQGEREHGGVRVLRFPVQRAPGPPIVYPILRRLMLELSRFGPGATPLLKRLALLTPRMPALLRYLDSPDLADAAIVHSTNITLDFTIIPTARWARRRNVPHLITPFVHLGEPHDTRIVRYYSMPHQIDLLRRATRVATMTDLERAYLLRCGLPETQVRTVGAGVSLEELAGGDRTRFREAHRIHGPMVLSMGVAAYDKGTVHMIAAMRRLWAEGSAAIWVQCGPLMGHFEQQLAALAPEEKARIRVLGYVDDAVRRDALAAADVYAQPSRTDSFGITYLEAWVYGVPVIGARAGGVPAVIHETEDGLLVPFGDIDALAATIKRLLEDRALARRLGEAGYARVRRELTWDAVYDRVRALYTL